ncbi:DUF4129 domain-containing protein [uncultured Kordia sp.]|uniref:DUF4129 domain-containing protein n=1 Tax=uncultured Kordia sp. TaxID=507699 RepID=UPI0026306422|nr:DUF4129 domain-containing protein [uncultured Kordia sp.]
MLKKLKYILLSFLFLGTMLATASAVRQMLPLQEDSSDVQPRTFEDNFKDTYDGSEYVYEIEKTDGWFTRLVNWLERQIDELFNLGSRKKAAKYLNVVKLIFYGLIIVAVVYFIVRAIMNGEGRWVFGKRSDKKLIEHEDVETNIHIVDFDALIKEATTNNDYRLAVRYQYLNMLKKMSNYEIISYDPEKTNLEYTYEIKNESLREQFQYASYLYNYIWYGEFIIDQTQYNKASNSFNVLLKNIAA